MLDQLTSIYYCYFQYHLSHATDKYVQAYFSAVAFIFHCSLNYGHRLYLSLNCYCMHMTKSLFLVFTNFSLL